MSGLKICSPYVIGVSEITSSNVALETLWTAGTYALGVQRRYNDVLWEVVAVSTTQTPSSTSTDWVDIGPPNRYRAFDIQVGLDQPRVTGTVTENADSIAYTFENLERITGFGFLNVEAESIYIHAEFESEVVLDITYALPDRTRYNGSFYAWYFFPARPATEYINLEVSIPAGSVITVSVDKSGSTVKLGSLVLGRVEEFGTVERGSSRTNNSYSIKTSDGLTTSLVRRFPSRAVRYTVKLQDYRAFAFWQAVEELEGTAALFAGPTSSPELVAYGFLENVNTVAQANGVTELQAEVKSL